MPQDVPSRSIGELTYPDISKRLRASSILCLPIGSIEQHGPHLPLNTDVVLAEEFTRRIIARWGDTYDLWQLPTQAVSLAREHEWAPGTLSLSIEGMTRLIRDLGREIARSMPARNLAIINGHGGNRGILEALAQDLRGDFKLNVCILHPTTWADIHAASKTPEIHGGRNETSMMLATAPHLVRADEIKKLQAASGADAVRTTILDQAVTWPWTTNEKAIADAELLATQNLHRRNSASSSWKKSPTRQAAFSSSFWNASSFCAARHNAGCIAIVCPRGEFLRNLAVAAGIGWSLAFVIVALVYELQLYADGAIFSYAVAVQDVWAFHWHNIANRASVFFLSLWPAEILVGLTGSPAAGIITYGFLFYVAPLIGLVGTLAVDRSRGRIFFAYACASTALLCPLIFGFPTEMWIAHALFWPALALAHYARRGISGAAILSVMITALALTHAGGVVLAFVVVATLALHGFRHPLFLRGAIALFVAMALWIIVKMVYPPDDYFADVLVRAGLHFFDPAIFQVNLVVLLIRCSCRLRPPLSRAVPDHGCGHCAASGLSCDSNRPADLLAAVRPVGPCKQSVLSSHGAGRHHSGLRCVVGRLRNAGRRRAG